MPASLAKDDRGSASGAAGVTIAGELAEKGIEVTAKGSDAADVVVVDDDGGEAEDLVVSVSSSAFRTCIFP